MSTTHDVGVLTILYLLISVNTDLAFQAIESQDMSIDSQDSIEIAPESSHEIDHHIKLFNLFQKALERIKRAQKKQPTFIKHYKKIDEDIYGVTATRNVSLQRFNTEPNTTLSKWFGVTDYLPKENSFVALVTDQQCDNVASCLYPYVSYFAILIMFFLVMYLIIVFGRCVCDESY